MIEMLKKASKMVKDIEEKLKNKQILPAVKIYLALLLMTNCGNMVQLGIDKLVVGVLPLSIQLG